MAGRGIQYLPLSRIPAKWDPVWFEKFCRDVLALADARNSIGEGLDISGQPDQVATFSVNADLLELLQQSLVVAQPSGFLNFERTLAGNEGVQIIDGGPNSNITVELIWNGVSLGKLQQVGALSVLANPTNALGNVQSVAAADDGAVFARMGTALDFWLTPVWKGDHTWNDNFAVKLGTGGDLVLKHDGAASSITNATGLLTIDSAAGVAIVASAGIVTASGTSVTLTAGTGALSIVAATSFKVRTNGVDRFEIDNTGAWLLAGSAGTAGQVPTSAGAGAPPVWATPAAGGGGSGGVMLFVGEVVAGAASTSLSISGLNLNADEMYEVEVNIDNGSGSTALLSLNYNADTTATNYFRGFMNGTSLSSANDAQMDGLLTTEAGRYRISITKDFDGKPRAFFSFSRATGASMIRVGSHLWNNTANVTSLQIVSSVASAISAGSYIRVWKVLRTGGGAAAGGLWDFVGDFAVAGAAATDLTITGLNLDADEMYCVIANLSGAAAGAATLNVFFNGDTTAANYRRSLNGTAGSNSAIGGLDNSQPGQWIGYLRRCPVTGRVLWTAHGGRMLAAAALDYSSTVIWQTSANLTSLTFNSSVASQIAIGSKVRVFKLRASSSTRSTYGVYANADQSKASDTTLADDATLVATLSANKKYRLEFDVFWDTSATPDLKFDLNFTGTTTSVFWTVDNRSGPTANVPTISTSTTPQSFACSALNVLFAFNVSANTTLWEKIFVTIEVGAAGGVFSLRWAQNTSSASATVRRRNSCLLVTEVP